MVVSAHAESRQRLAAAWQGGAVGLAELARIFTRAGLVGPPSVFVARACMLAQGLSDRQIADGATLALTPKLGLWFAQQVSARGAREALWRSLARVCGVCATRS